MTKEERGNQAKANRRKGHGLERRIRLIFIALGFSKCRTARQASRLLDDSKVDLAMIPYNVQCKAGYPTGINYIKLFTEMSEGLVENFMEGDPVIDYPKIIIHDRLEGKGSKLVIMQEEEFWELFKSLKNGKT